MEDSLSTWKDDLRRRFADREVLSDDDSFERFWAAVGVGREVVDGALATLEEELGIERGRLRPTDEFDEIFRRPPQRRFFRRVAAEIQAGDAQLYIALELERRLKELGFDRRARKACAREGRLLTLAAFVREWAGLPREHGQA
jgi:hypothetical protein